MSESATVTEMRSGFLPDRIVHLHPTRTCNLACLHCYSESGPRQRTTLDLESVQRVLPTLRSEGYQLISISGGEPLTYPHLLPLVENARAQGFRVTMISNGLFSKERLDAVTAKLDGVAISFDGMAETHNRLRGRPDAFERASRTVAWLSSAGRPVAAAISLTPSGISELPDLADYLVALGVRRLQVRPMALAGRAKTMTGAAAFTAADRARLYLVVLALQQELGEQATLHCDLAPVQSLWAQRGAYSNLLSSPHQLDSKGGVGNRLADLVNPLVITDSGVLRPIAFDFDPAFDVGSIETISSASLSGFKRDGVRSLQGLIGGALAALKDGAGVVDWFDHCARLSERLGCTLQEDESVVVTRNVAAAAGGIQVDRSSGNCRSGSVY
jgi:pyruvate-formate lyase-activating enzyme